jgi:uncharacterized iron-regulated membrane protein
MLSPVLLTVIVCLPWFTELSAAIKNVATGFPIGATKGPYGEVLKLAALDPVNV